ncbi:bifunctional UDP-sugar hydrolase/5'-nucleotidase UshA [Vibrio sp. JC009]|uniref:bifunctional UDP-sugar hydrolase/5'-nucleotidase UshA n=1 Tax=Vibrio sp. JC009 TaxID=2912314 RepID=UPI0023B17722|nr:bifunctional UDP-sugar hydrolase/5'-nucleotidase UshA [Vibrio sp. JC009]WED24768.1 bifunctional UDP-sugar hydrolase/5'-nucleotidase UshA [Vibrio sp. JC009]
MKRFILSTLALSICASTQVASEPAQIWEKDKEYKITILHTNDNHGAFWKNKYGERGMAARATLVKQIRSEVQAQGGSVLLLSAGDINTGAPESDLLDAKPDIIGMNLMDYDLMTVGNHEFDNPLEVLQQQEEWADFPFIAANVYKDGKRLFQPYLMMNKNGVKIAIVGLTTEDTAKLGNPEYVAGIEFTDPRAEMEKIIAELEKSEKPDVVIASTHLGHYADGKHGSNAPGDVALARTFGGEKIDLIVSGHSHDAVCMENGKQSESYLETGVCVPDEQNGTTIVQALDQGKYLGRADYTFKNGEFELDAYKLIPVNMKKKVKDAEGKKVRVFIDKEIPEDPAVLAALQEFQEQGQAALNVKVGSVNQELVGERSIVRNNQTNLGRMIATTHMQRTKADFAIMNSGGVRASIQPGDISYKDILTVQPFGNTVTLVDMTGTEVMDYLSVVATKQKDSGAYPQFAGISMTIAGDKVSEITIGGKALDPEQTYRFSIPSYNAGGGDGYPVINTHPAFVDTGYVDAEVLKEFIQTNSPVDAGQFTPNNEITHQ